MRYLEKFNKRMALSGNSIRNEHIKNSRELLFDTFADDASFSFGIYKWELGKKDYSKDEEIAIRIYERAFSNANGVSAKFQTTYDFPIVVGDVLYDSGADEFLICTEVFNIDKIHYQGKLHLCNWMLKWQNKNGDILEYPCQDINTTQYNSGEQANKQFTIGSSQHMLILPCDENTVLLSSPQRFFLDKNTENPTSFIVTQNDTTTLNFGKKGLVRVTVLECATNNEKDRIDLGICDYFEKDQTNVDNSNDNYVSKSVISYNSLSVKSGGNIQTFIGKFYNDKGEEVPDILPMWEVICDFSEALNISIDGDRISIGIDNDNYIDEDFKIVLSDKDGNYTSSIIVKVDSLL